MLVELIRVLPPPHIPLERGNLSEWTNVELTLGTKLPQDYKDYIDTYGTGDIGEFIWVYNPFSKSKHVNLTIKAPSTLATLLELTNAAKGTLSEERYPFSLYPKVDGLFPWGKTDNGDNLFWQTTGHPDDWTVVAFENRGVDIDRYPGSMTSFLAAIISRSVRSKVIPFKYIDRDANGTAVFNPFIPE